MVKRPNNDTRPRTCITSLQGIILEANRLTTRYAAAGCSSLASLRSHHIPVAPLQIAVPLRCPQFLFTTPTKEIVHRNLEATTARATNHMDLILLDSAPTTVGLAVKLSSLPFHCSKQRKRGVSYKGYRKGTPPYRNMCFGHSVCTLSARPNTRFCHSLMCHPNILLWL